MEQRSRKKHPQAKDRTCERLDQPAQAPARERGGTFTVRVRPAPHDDPTARRHVAELLATLLFGASPVTT